MRIGIRRVRGLAVLLVVPPLLASGCVGSHKSPGDPAAAGPLHDMSAATGSAGSVKVEDVFIPPPPAGIYRAGTGVLVNVTLSSDGSEWDSVVSGSTPVAQQVALSQYNIDQDFLSVPNDDQRVSGVVQLHDISRPIAPGQAVPLTLQFSSGESATLQVPVRRPS
jgi:copper(I)-binding protein